VTAGYNATRANSFLNVLRNTAYSAVATPFVKLHVGDPGAAGTTNPSAVTTRNAITWNAAAAGSMTLLALSAFTMTTSETITHISIWDASTAGNFVESWPLTSSVAVVNGSTLTFSTFTLSLTPIAA
jgi:hypothetical protein